jgi:adenosylhomocysteinase
MVKTVTGENYEVHDLSLAEKGQKRIDWARKHMPVLGQIREEFKKEQPLKGVKIGACLHCTKETAVLVTTLRDGGAEVFLCASNPLSTQDDVVAALTKEKNISVYAWHDMDNEGYYRSIANVITKKPQISIDDGCDLVTTLHKLKNGSKDPEIETVKKYGATADLMDNIWAGAEETTTGIIRLRAMAKDGALKYPVLATNDTPTKQEYDNLWGTGQSTIDGILRGTEELIASKVFVVSGYGHCGRGVAIRARGLGARVIITEIDPHAALTAVMEGFEVKPMTEAAKEGDIFCTATGCKGVIRLEHMETMKDGAVVSNTGHFSVEVDVVALEKAAVKHEEIKHMVDRYTMKNGKSIIVLAGGRLVNLALATGHAAEVMDLSFSDQALAAEYITKNKNDLKAKGGVVVDIPDDIDIKVATLKCKALGINLDKLTPEQEKYLSGWSEGTA